jgi:flagellar assembly protein FliH
VDNRTKTAKQPAEPRRFMFDQSFDAGRRQAKKPKPEDEKPPEPTFNLQQIEEARQQSYEQGRTAGSAESAASVEAEIARLVAAIAAQLPTLMAAQASANDRLMHDGATLVAAIARKILPALVAQHGLGEVDSLIADCLRTLIDQPKIVVRVSTRHTEEIATRLAAAASVSAFDGRFMVEADEAMGPSDCRVSWQGGGLERKAEDIWRQVETAIEAFLGKPAEAAGAGATAADSPETQVLPAAAGDAAGPATAPDLGGRSDG